MKATASQLAQVPLFQTVATEWLDFLKPHTTIVPYQKNEIIIHEGDTFRPKLHLVFQGRILVKKISAAGKETVLRQLSAGEMFAAPALFGDRIAPATVLTLEPSDILLVNKEALLQAIQTTPAIALQILTCFNQRIQEMDQTIHGLVSERAIVRLIRLIQYMAKHHGVETTTTGDCLNTKLPYQQMARMVGITYEECIRLINKEIKPAIDYARGGVITIRDAATLTALVEANGG
ncbi:MAG: Crp/Fnr family transcriptional regulator [Cyanobacteria bacterium P01_F01_bin.53]